MNRISSLIKSADMQVYAVPAGTVRIICCSGVVWLTSEGSSEDILLESGMEADLKNLKNVCLQGIGENTFELIRN